METSVTIVTKSRNNHRILVNLAIKVKIVAQIITAVTEELVTNVTVVTSITNLVVTVHVRSNCLLFSSSYNKNFSVSTKFNKVNP